MVTLITRGYTAGDGTVTRPAECHWHLVIVRQHGHIRTVVVGSWTTAGVVMPRMVNMLFLRDEPMTSRNVAVRSTNADGFFNTQDRL